ncbi:MAG TPA: FHA domain-containing protein, partial [Anaerolineaceae bacterium]
PLEISVAVDPAPSMAVYTPSGQTRYDLIAAALTAWAKHPSSGQPDHFNLFAPNSAAATGLSYRSDWLGAFNNLKIDLQTPRPTLYSLTQAVQQAEASPADPGTARAALWITAPPEGTLLASFPGLVGRAQKAGLRLFIWSVSPAVAFHSQSAQALAQAAGQTGGQFFAFSGPEALPDPDSWFNPLRGVYTLRYTSQARTAGSQTVAARVQQAGGDQTSPAQTFQLDFQPPNPILLSPPAVVRRACPVDCTDPAAQLSPGQVALRILVEFPDQHPRPLAAVRLYVDGKLAAERTSEPFNQVPWDLRGLTSSGTAHLSVEAVDKLGLSRRSLETPVQVEISIARTPAWRKMLNQPGVKPGLAAAAAAVFLGLAFFFGRRNRGAIEARLRAWRSRLPPGRTAARSPVRAEAARAGAAHRPWGAPAGKPTARLIRLDEAGQPTVAPPVPLAGREVTFGRDPGRAEIILDEPSADALHASLVPDGKGGWSVMDKGSTAGTWVNYAPVPPEGAALEHGDVIHLGLAAFRYEVVGNPPRRQVVIEKLTEKP